MNSVFVVKQNPNSLFAQKYRTHIPIDKNLMKMIIDSGWDKCYKDSKDWCKRNRIPSDTLTATGHLQMLYKQFDRKSHNNLYCTLQKNSIGRAYYHKAINLSSLPREVKQALCCRVDKIHDDGSIECEDLLYDYDLANAQPNILYQMCKKADIPKTEYNYIRKYCKNRDKMLLAVKEQLMLDDDDWRATAKGIFLIALNPGSIRNYVENAGCTYEEHKDSSIIIIVEQFKKQVKKIFTKYFKPANEGLYNDILIKKQKVKTDTMRSFIARILQHKECEVVESVIRELIKTKQIQNGRFDYAYDGFVAVEKLDTKLLDKITKELGWNLSWTIKEPDEGIDLWEEVKNLLDSKKEQITHPPNTLKCFDNEYFNSLYGNYDKLKDYFERFYSFVKFPQPMYIHQGYTPGLKDGKKILKYTFDYLPEAKIKEMYKHIHSRIEVTKFGTTKKFPFINDYIEDRHKKIYERMDFIPYNLGKPYNYDKQVLNTFTGYNPICFQKGIKFNPNSIKRGGILFSFREVLKHLVGGDKEREVFENLIAYKIKYPLQKLPYAILIKGHQGSGKNTLLYQLSKIIRSPHYITTANIKDVIGKHSEGLMNKLIVNINEVNFNDTKNMGDVLKSLVSENTKVFDMKYVRPIEQTIFALLVLTTNGKMPIPLDVMTGERRWFVFESDGVNKQLCKEQMINGKKTTGWKHIHKNIWDTDEFVQQLYLYLMTLPIEDYNFQKAQTDMTRTPAYNKLASYFIDPLALMLRDFICSGSFDTYATPLFEIDSDDEKNCEIQQYYQKDEFYEFITIKATKLNDYYKDWYEKYKGDATWVGIKNSKSFVNGIANLPCKIEKQTKCSAVWFVFKPRDVLQELVNTNILQVDMSKWNSKKVEEQGDFGF